MDDESRDYLRHFRCDKCSARHRLFKKLARGRRILSQANQTWISARAAEAKDCAKVSDSSPYG